MFLEQVVTGFIKIEIEISHAILIINVQQIDSQMFNKKSDLLKIARSPHNGRIAAPAYHCSVQYVTFENEFRGKPKTI